MANTIADWLKQQGADKKLKEQYEKEKARAVMKHDAMCGLGGIGSPGGVYGNPYYDPLQDQYATQLQKIWNQQVAAQKPPPPKGVVTEDVIKTNGIFEAPLSSIRLAWQLKFPGWIKPNSFGEMSDKCCDEDVFMFKRLLANNEFEIMQTDNGHRMYRLKEREET